MDNSSKENKEVSTVKSPVTLNTPIISPPAVDNRRSCDGGFANPICEFANLIRNSQKVRICKLRIKRINR